MEHGVQAPDTISPSMVYIIIAYVILARPLPS